MNKKIVWVIICCFVLVSGAFYLLNLEKGDDSVKIGVITSLTGWPAFWGDDITKSVDLAISEINQAGGINGKRVSVVYEDMGAIDLKSAASAANKLINVDKVDILVTTFLEDTIVASPLAHNSNLPLISIAAGNKGVEQTKNLFRIRPYFEGVFPTASVDYFSKIGKTKPTIIYEELAYYVNYKDETIKSWVEITGVSPVTYSSTGDIRDAILKAVSGGTDFIYLRMPTPSQIEAIRRIKEISPNITIEGTEAHDPAFFSAGNLTDGMFYVDYKPDPKNDFQKKFQEKYKREPGLPATLAYDAIYAIEFALQDVNEVNTKNILKGLKKVSFDGASGKVSFNEDQNRLVENDRVQLYRKVEGTFIEVD
jgi:branched-chain amino acid transport system substrate-binding protein